MARAWIGCSGWSYDHWVGVLYPPGTPKSRWRDVYTQHFDTVELNASFYRWPGERAFVRWNELLPPGFVMAVKASRWISHGRRLRDPDGAWGRRLSAASRGLGERAGPVLVQPPMSQERDDELLETFLAGLPDGLRVAVELRHPSWSVEEIFSLLGRHGAAYVVLSGAHMPCVLRATASFVYVRLHGPGPEHLYDESYSEDDLHWWADRVREWLIQDREVFVYFNNDGRGHAVRNAQRLRALLGSAATAGGASSVDGAGADQ